ncbi:type II toxin-antitoxin system VapC family toxin [Arcobacter cloacae]|uniref:Ribonuclease VapC n=1 Tax=Arcobacter cloacae TaxID=1054034 RepID=A0A6M8NFF5_9BACT|nr:type II toxin-antitoxin system VapC family toxin [Arcobacter cloacae]QKF89995.1 PIN domain-containing protein [Arcobacter cloacae]RXI37205.1 VapC toxin family PIN domain ribonuclease [Arcobacter cloacae]
MYLLDTNTVIYFFKGLGDISKNLFNVSPKDIFIPSIVVYELEVGIAKSNDSQKRQEQLKKLLSQINIINFTQTEAVQSAKIRADLEKKGTPIGSIDILIAGCAKANNLILVTRNTKEFQRVENLQLIDWY